MWRISGRRHPAGDNRITECDHHNRAGRDLDVDVDHHHLNVDHHDHHINNNHDDGSDDDHIDHDRRPGSGPYRSWRTDR
jgi:hypothetical protein